MTEVYEKRDEIRDQIEYGLIANSANREQLNELVEIMLEVALSRAPTMKIGQIGRASCRERVWYLV